MLLSFQSQHSRPSIKICGITSEQDAIRLAELQVDAIGFNFWPKSKRYLAPKDAALFSHQLKGRILRVGVFVNENMQRILELLHTDVIDLAQLHGDEDSNYCAQLQQHGFPIIKALGIANASSLNNLQDYQANAILLDAHAPGIYGGTGEIIDWNLAKNTVSNHPETPIILAGGITPENAGRAASTVKPYALDIASGAEISPGVKDINKVIAIQNAVKDAIRLHP